MKPTDDSVSYMDNDLLNVITTAVYLAGKALHKFIIVPSPSCKLKSPEKG